MPTSDDPSSPKDGYDAASEPGAANRPTGLEAALRADPATSRRLAYDDELPGGQERTRANVNTAAGGGSFETRTRPGSPLNQSQVVLYRTAAAALWLVSSAWALGMLLVVPNWLAASLSVVPALLLLSESAIRRGMGNIRDLRGAPPAETGSAPRADAEPTQKDPQNVTSRSQTDGGDRTTDLDRDGV